jgi:hypothetical protein
MPILKLIQLQQLMKSRLLAEKAVSYSKKVCL